MDDLLFIKYITGICFTLLFFLGYVIVILFQKKKPHRQRNIAIHVTSTILLCVFIFLINQHVNMAITDFNLKIISFEMVDFISTAAMLLVLLVKSFQLLNRLENHYINNGGDPTSVKMVYKLLKLSVFFIMILLFGERFGMSVSGLMTFGGIGGIAIGLAGREILSNFFSGIMLYFDRPFNIGDWIRSPDRDIEGTVVEIGWRITTIRTFDHRPLYVPNYVFSSISVENPGQMTNRRITADLGLRYEDAKNIPAIVDDIRSMLQRHDKIDTTRTLLVYFNRFADSSLNVMVYCFTKTTVWSEWLEIQQDVYLKIIDIVQKNNSDFAYPTQTLLNYNMDKNAALMNESEIR